MPAFSKGQAAGHVPVEAAAVRVSWVARGTLAVGGHWVADPHWTPLDVFHLVGPVAVTDRLHRPVMIVDVDWILSATPGKRDGKGWWTICRTSVLAVERQGGDGLLPRGSTVLHRWWCRWARWGHSSPPGCWCSSGGSRSCSRAPPSPVPALLPWQPAAFSAGCSTDAHHKRGWGSDTSERVKRSQDWLNGGIFSAITHQW